MRIQKMTLSSFSRALSMDAQCIRPENEPDLIDFLHQHPKQTRLARGAGLSYNDSCLTADGYTIDTQRFNHLIHFDPSTGILECQAGVTFNELFLVHPDFIPPVIPGTLHATVGGGVAHDVHGKNNHQAGSFGQHLLWIDLLLNNEMVRCSRDEKPELFHATIAGLGLTGIILRLGIRLKKASRAVQAEYMKFKSFEALFDVMGKQGLEYDHQAAWLDLLNKPHAVLHLAKECSNTSIAEQSEYKIPPLPFGLIKGWNMRCFNQLYFHRNNEPKTLSLAEFNNPLDRIQHWNRLYGPKGLIQFQAVFAQQSAAEVMNYLVQLIHLHQATPTLAVMKYFTKEGNGLLSFCQPGFSVAIDFIHNAKALKAIAAMNSYLNQINARVYLAKDLLLTPVEFHQMYPKHAQFLQVLSQNQCPMNSQLAKRLGIKS